MTTDVKAWRAGQVVAYELPSGNVARLKRVAVMDLVEQGDIPDTLSGMVADLVDETLGKRKTLSVEDLRRFAEVVNLVAKACFVEPPLGDEATEEQLAVAEVAFVDRAEVFRWANQPTRQLRPFRVEAPDSVSIALHQLDVPSAAKSNAGDGG